MVYRIVLLYIRIKFSYAVTIYVHFNTKQIKFILELIVRKIIGYFYAIVLKFTITFIHFRFESS